MRIFLYSAAGVLAGFGISALAGTTGHAPIEALANVPDPALVLLVGLVTVVAGWRVRLH